MKPGGNILVLTQWSFKDALVQTYTLPYIDIIRGIIPSQRKIILITAEQPHIALTKDEAARINKDWQQRNMQLLPQPYQRFGLKKLIASAGNLLRLIGVIKKEKIKTVHAFCTPAGSIAYLLCKITSADLVVDSYEPHAESMVENGTWKRFGLAHRILFSFEKKLTRKAKFLIGTTAGMKDYALNRYGIDIKNFFVKPACVDLVKFSAGEKDSSLLKELYIDSKIVCVYAGKLGGIYLKDEVFDFIRSCYDHWRDNFRFLLLTNATSEEINNEIKRTGVPMGVVISRFVYHHEIPRYLSLGDFAINPVKPVPTKRYCTSIKDGEYWAQGLPVVISPNISDDSAIIEQENTGVVLDFTDKLQYLPSIKKIEQLLKSKDELKKKIRNIGVKYRSYNIAENIYKTIYSDGRP